MGNKSVKQYVVIPLYLSGIGNRIFRNGDVVTESEVAINGRTIEGLIADGFVKEKGKETAIKEAEIAIKADDKTENNSKNDLNKTLLFETEDGTKVFNVDDCTKKEIIQELKIRGIDFESSETKNALFQKLQ